MIMLQVFCWRNHHYSINIVDKINGKTAENFINEIAAKGSTLITDYFNIYNALSNEGFQHKKYLSNSPEGQKALEWLHTVVVNAKAFIIGTYHGLSNRHLQAYTDEFCYRFNRRHWIDELFPRLLNACVSASTVTWAELTG
jgi:transposase-like protein